MVLKGNFAPESGAAAIRSVLQSDKKISAVFFHNDRMALGALEQCRKMGARVPEDISIVGYDDIPFCDYTQPGLTTIHQSLDLIGEAAARLVHDLLEGYETVDIPQFNLAIFTPRLAERESVANLNEQRAYTRLVSSELECLEWTAVGKTHSEISHILGSSESTVDLQLRSAVAKLNATNEIHAVSIALRSGLIKGRN